ncbi:MAG: XdhC family protein [Lysobacterales bacterium]
MSERLWRQLDDWLGRQPVIVASVLAASGATPRRAGSRMLITTEACAFSIGGGLAEARVIAAARALLASGGAADELAIDLTGRAHSAGVCGGQMRIGLRRFAGPDDRASIAAVVASLGAGRRAELPGPGPTGADGHWLQPDPRLLISGAGHCGLALYHATRALDFDLWVHDTRPGCFAGDAFAEAECLCGEAALLARAWDSERAVYAVLLNRDFHADLAVLAALAGRPLAYLGMMGSQRRIAEVRERLAASGLTLPELHAPVGIEIDAETPAEIAISIAAELIAVRRMGRAQRPSTA